MSRVRLLLLSLTLLGLVGCAPQAAVQAQADEGNAPSAASPKTFGKVGAFEFDERRGGTVTREDLSGAPWAVAFIFTHCSTICPAMTQELSYLTGAVEDTGAKVVAITIDPERDTLEVLSEYASHFEHGDSEDWLFLRGSEARVHALILGSFKLGVARMEDADPGLEFSHSSKIVVVDAEGAIRGYYDGTFREGTEAAAARLRYLATGEVPASATSPLPTVNAALNTTAAILLMLGLVAIKRGRKKRHEHLMKGAFVASAAFLASYLYYHFVVIPAQGGPVRFEGEDTAKVAYLVLLATHVLGAIVNLPMVLRTFWLAHKERWESHKRWARWTFPLWMYVSVTGVIVYAALYVM